MPIAERIIDRRIIQDALEIAQSNIWADEASIYEGYSGRFMYGDTCFGIVGPFEIGDAFLAALKELEEEYHKANLGDESYEEPDEFHHKVLKRKMRSDNMGRSYIFYFPGFELS